MEQPLQITIRGMPSSEAILRSIRTKLRKLERHHPDITSCHVVVQAPLRHQHKGGLYSVRLEVHVPGLEVVAGRGRDEHHAHEDVYVALRDAFDAALRQLDEHRAKGRHERRKAPRISTG